MFLKVVILPYVCVNQGLLSTTSNIFRARHTHKPLSYQRKLNFEQKAVEDELVTVCLGHH